MTTIDRVAALERLRRLPGAVVRRAGIHVRRILAGRQAETGSELLVESGAQIIGSGRIVLGDGVRLMDHSRLWATRSGSLSIGARTFVGSHSWIVANERVSIGADVLIAPFCYIQDTDHGFTDPDVPIAQQPSRSSAIEIGDDVWLGAHVVVTRGVMIGRGSVIGAGSVVTHDVPPFTVAAGVPARPIGRRGEPGDGVDQASSRS